MPPDETPNVVGFGEASPQLGRSPIFHGHSTRLGVVGERFAYP